MNHRPAAPSFRDPVTKTKKHHNPGHSRAVHVRIAATRTLLQTVHQGRSLSQVLPSTLDQVANHDRGFLQEICYGTLRWYPRLQSLLSLLLDKPLKPREQAVRILLLISLYQLLYLRIPAYAVVSQAVTTARALGKPWAAGLINGILRNFERHRQEWLTALVQNEEGRYGHPAWLLRRFRQDWPADWQAIVAANNEYPPQNLRINLTRLSRQAYLERLANIGIEASVNPVASAAVTLQTAVDIQTLPGFDQGWVSIQDPAAQLAAELLDLRPGLRVLDACAAPGGKTCHILERESALTNLTAVDNDTRRLERLEENLQRLGLRAEIVTGNVLEPSTWWSGRLYDRILLDAPCSATGVIRRHPDIKVLRRDEDIDSLAARQRVMLERLWDLLAPGGTLVYATCSVLKRENEAIVADFLRARPDARETPILAPWGRASSHGRQILPGESTMDGFYYARLSKQD